MGILSNYKARITCVCGHKIVHHNQKTLFVKKPEDATDCKKCDCDQFKQQPHEKLWGKY